MNKKILVILLYLFVPALNVFSIPDSEILYDCTDLGSGRWQYNYRVRNISLTEEIEEFTIWFGYGFYDNLTIETLNPPAGNWDEIILQPDPMLSDDGGYDALTNALNIGIGQSVSGFAVSFDWLGTGDPGTQYYEIIDSDTFETIEDGYTELIPEPATLLLLGLGVIVLRRKTRP